MPAGKKRKRSAKVAAERPQSSKKPGSGKSKKAKSNSSEHVGLKRIEELKIDTSDARLSWFDLPKEIRLHILSFTNLVVREHCHHVVPDLRIHNGKILPNSRSPITRYFFEEEYEEWEDIGEYTCRLRPDLKCPCTSTPAAILQVPNKLFHNEAMETLLSHNRLVFEPQKPQKILKFLESQGDLVRKIRQLDIQFTLLEPNEEQAIIPRCHNWKKNSGAQYRNWKALVAFIRDNLFLEKLDLSLDGGLDLVVYREYDDAFATQMTFSDAKDTYNKIVKPFRDFGPKKGLKSFNVFFASDAQQELKAERLVIGPDHLPTDKKCPRHREPYYPHDPLTSHRQPVERKLLMDRRMDEEEDFMAEHALFHDDFWDEDDLDYDEYDDFFGGFPLDPMDLIGNPYFGLNPTGGPTTTN